MFDALFGSIGYIVRRPAVLLPAIVTALFSAALFVAGFDLIMRFLWDALIVGILPEVSEIELPYMLMKMYGTELGVIALLGVLNLAAGVWLVFVYGYLIKGGQRGKVTLGSAVGYAISRLWNVIYVSGFIALIALLFMLLGIFTAWISSLQGIGIIGLPLMLIAALAAMYVFIKLTFLPAVMAADDAKLKIGIAKTWKWSAGKLPGIVLFLILLSGIAGAVQQIGLIAAGFFEDEFFAFLAFAVFAVIANAYFSIAIVKYYAAVPAARRRRRR